MSVFAWIAVGLAAIGGIYQLVQLAAAMRFFRRAQLRWGDAHEHTPPVTLLKPLKGPGIDLYQNLETFCRQDYPEYEIVFGVADPADPAAETVRRLQRAHPDLAITLTLGEAEGANAKVGNLICMMQAATHDVFVLSDADIRVRPDYLKTLVKPFRDPRIGLTTCLYRGRGDFGFPSILESLHDIGRKGIELKRFKGLGEMNPEELWDTTMDPEQRSLLRVSWDTASDADQLFTTLMGENVESRRAYIEDHALEVKNLDV